MCGRYDLPETHTLAHPKGTNVLFGDSVGFAEAGAEVGIPAVAPA